MKTKHSSSVRRGISFGTIFMTALTVVVIGLSAAVLPRLLGMEMDFDTLRFTPFRTVDLEIKELLLAGVTVTVRVEAGWTRCLVNGVEAEPVIDRACSEATLEFVR